MRNRIRSLRIGFCVCTAVTIPLSLLTGCTAASEPDQIVEQVTADRIDYTFNEVTFTLSPDWEKQDETEVNNDNYQIAGDGKLIGFMMVSQSYVGNLADDTQYVVDSWLNGVNATDTLNLSDLTEIEGQDYPAYLATADVDSSGVPYKGKAKLLLSGGTIYSIIAVANQDDYVSMEPELDSVIDSADIEYPMPLFDDEMLQDLGMSDTEEPAESPEQSIALGDGTYRIGTDAQAGEYKITATSADGKGYWEVTNSSAPDADITGNDFFTGTSYVTVSDGQYLTLSNARAELVQ